MSVYVCIMKALEPHRTPSEATMLAIKFRDLHLGPLAESVVISMEICRQPAVFSPAATGKASAPRFSVQRNMAVGCKTSSGGTAWGAEAVPD